MQLLPMAWPDQCPVCSHHEGGGVRAAPTTGASKGQVWTRHLAPAAPAFPRPSSPSQFIACPLAILMSKWRIVLPCTPHGWRERQGLMVPGVLTGSRLGIVTKPMSYVAALLFFFLAQTKMSWHSPITSQYSG